MTVEEFFTSLRWEDLRPFLQEAFQDSRVEPRRIRCPAVASLAERVVAVTLEDWQRSPEEMTAGARREADQAVAVMRLLEGLCRLAEEREEKALVDAGREAQ